jgi:hypothetical protein
MQNQPKYPIPTKTNIVIFIIATLLNVYLLWLASHGVWWEVLLAAWGFALFHNTLFSLLHEAVHGVFSPNPKINNLFGHKVSKEAYGKNLEANLENLYTKIRNGSFKPSPKREMLIPKANGKTRPIEIACFEDKLVDVVVSKILSAVYEPLFIRNSFGFREHKSLVIG